MNKTLLSGLVLAAAIGCTLPLKVFADSHGHRGGGGYNGRGRGGHWHGDIHRFNQYDFPRWRSGGWHHESHSGRLGWWWVIGNSWYWYPTVINPYPDPYIPPVIIQQEQPPVVQAQPQVQTQMWYYCNSPVGFYPYVSACPTGWTAVPATPPTTQPVPQAQFAPPPPPAQR